MFRKMTRLLRLVLCIGLVVAPVSACHAFSDKVADMPAGAYAIEKQHASITAKVMHEGFSNYTFRFLRFDAAYKFDPANPTATKLRVMVDPSSIDTDTGNDSFGKMFDTMLAGEDWFDTKKFPTATFVSTGIDLGNGHRGKVAGNLTLHGVTKRVVLDVTFNGSGWGMPPGTFKSGFSATTVIKRSDFGMTKFLGGVGDEVTLNIEIEFVKT
jgi:polyisoprenoid-binding protein YceI